MTPGTRSPFYSDDVFTLMQVSKWLEHLTFTLTLDTYGDWIPEDGGPANTFCEHTAR